MRIFEWLRRRDAGSLALHRAVRVVLVSGGAFAFGLEVLDNEQVAVFGLFSGFALLGFADFGGTPREKARAYLLLSLVGALLVGLGTLVSETTWVAALVLVPIAFTARFVGCFGGAFQASVSPTILAYVLAATFPGSASEAPERMLGWAATGVVATVVALVVWPVGQRTRVRHVLADAADGLADVLRELAAGRPVAVTTEQRAFERLAALDDASVAPLRPAGPGDADASLRFVFDELRRIGFLVLGPLSQPAAGEDSRNMAELGARALRESAAALRGDGPPPDAAAIEREREARQQAIFERVDRARAAGSTPSEIIDLLDAVFVFRIAAYLAASLAGNAAILQGSERSDEQPLDFALEQPSSHKERVSALLRTHLNPGSVWFQDSLKSALAVGAAMLVAKSFELDHGFWVVLGTLSVLRSNAFDTGATALQAAVGTAAGFAVSSVVLVFVEFDRPVLWVISMVGLFVAAYAPQVLGFLVGQASFTVAVVCVFNLLEPDGWRTGLVRVEDIAIGATISLLVALVFWPRPADGQVRRLVAGLYRSLAELVPSAIAGLRAGATEPPAGFAQTRAIEHRARAAFVLLVQEAARQPERIHPWDRYLVFAAGARSSVEAMARLGRVLERADEEPAGCSDAFDALDREADRLAGAMLRVSAASDRGSAITVSAELGATVATETRPAVEACIAQSEPGRDGALLASAAGRDWLVVLAALLGHVVEGGGPMHADPAQSLS